MRLKKVIDAADAVAVIHSGDTVASVGYGGNGTPDQLFVSLEQRFLSTGSPNDLTLVFSTGQGDMKEKHIVELTINLKKSLSTIYLQHLRRKNF